MKNLKIEITKENAFVNNKKFSSANFTEEETKNFDPKEHQFYREKLFESYFFEKENYFKGIGCTCCNGKKDLKYMRDLIINRNLKIENLTFL